MNTDKIEARASEALTYLAETDEVAAQLKFDAAKAEHLYKSTVDAHFLALQGSIEIRKAQARANSERDYIAFLEAQRAYDVVKNKRDHEAIVVEWLRSLNANRRQGQ
jgi:hypothetical protein